MAETGLLQVPLCGVTGPQSEQRFPGYGHSKTTLWPSSRVVLCSVGSLGGLASVMYTLHHAPPPAPPVALNRNSAAIFVGSTGELSDSPHWLLHAEKQFYRLFEAGRHWYFGFWGKEGDQFCIKHNITIGCCSQIQEVVKDARWDIYYVSIMAFVLGALFCFGIYKVGYYAKPKAPRYWTNSPWNPFFDSFLEEVDVTEELKDAVQELFDLTTDPKRMGKGMDGSFVKHKGFKVTKVTRIENGHLWTSYMNAVKSTLRQTPHDRMKKMPEELVNNSKRALRIIEKHEEKIRSKEAACSFIDSLHLKKRLNETLLFHACPMKGARCPQTGELRFKDISPLEVVKKIGLDDRVGSTSGMLGSGTYFADMASKADQYAGKYGAPEDTTVGETASMFLARVALGCPYLTQTSLEQMRRPPSLKGHFDPNLLWETVKHGKPWLEKNLSMQICEKARFDSVMSDRQIDEKAKLYHEYAVYAKQCYPEFCVTYTRIASNSSRDSA